MIDLLRLIKNNNTVAILDQENLIENLNELFQLNLVEYMDGKLYLTEEGGEYLMHANDDSNTKKS